MLRRVDDNWANWASLVVQVKPLDDVRSIPCRTTSAHCKYDGEQQQRVLVHGIPFHRSDKPRRQIKLPIDGEADSSPPIIGPLLPEGKSRTDGAFSLESVATVRRLRSQLT